MIADAVERFISALDENDPESAASVVTDTVAAGSTYPEIMDELLAPALRWIGAQWENGRWTTQQEHRATAIVTGVVESIPTTPADTRNQRVLVSSAEGEWHTLPSLMVAATLELAGFEVLALQAPVPAGQFLSIIHEFGPRLVAISCQMPANLPGLRRTATVVRDSGIPVVVGGAAVNSDRLPHIGGNRSATAFQRICSTFDLAGTLTTPIPPLDHARAAGFEWLESSQELLAVRLAEVSNGQTMDSKADVLWMMRNLHAALLCDDESILSDYIAWQRRRIQTIGAGSTDGMIDLLRGVAVGGPDTVQSTIEEALRLAERGYASGERYR